MTPSFSEDFENLRNYYISKFPVMLEKIYARVIYLKENNIKEFEDIRDDMNKLILSANLFGFSQVNKIIKEIDVYFSNFAVRKRKGKFDYEFINKKFDEIKIVFSSPLLSKNADNEFEFIEINNPNFFTKLPVDWDKKIFICNYGHKKNILQLGTKLSYLGYIVEEFEEKLESLIEKIKKEKISMVIADINFLPENNELSKKIKEIKEKNKSFKIFYISDNNDFKSHLFAVRNCADAFFVTPVDVLKLVEKIEYFADINRDKSDHILIVGDDPVVLSYYSLLFKRNGMNVTTTTEPFSVLNIIAESAPDIVFIDMVMPNCNGIELAAIIRQYEEYVPIPIIIYSTFDCAPAANTLIPFSGYQFLSKYSDAKTIIELTINKIDRTKTLKGKIKKDSLTGLLNHVNLNDSFNREFARSIRMKTPLSYVMIDLDNFKSINDKYGHSTGDSVLKSIAHMFVERLRVTDIIGRYGGEEFVIVMSGTTTETAKIVIDEIRKNYSKIKHNANGEDFYVTFSCGIAGYPEITTAKEISAAADKAMYEAKNKGKNRVVVFGKE